MEVTLGPNDRTLRSSSTQPHVLPLTIDLAYSRDEVRQNLSGRRSARASWGLGVADKDAHLSPATKLPQEVVKTIMAYLIYGTRSLLACSQYGTFGWCCV